MILSKLPNKNCKPNSNNGNNLKKNIKNKQICNKLIKKVKTKNLKNNLQFFTKLTKIKYSN